MTPKVIVGREFRHGCHVPAEDGVRDDMHVVKEVLHYEDGTSEPALRFIRNFKRPFWVTKEHYQNHKEKKESELLERVNMYTATDSGLGKAVLSRLGSRYIGKTNLRDAKDNPYIYGIDIKALTMIKHGYMKKYESYNTEYTVASLDIETDPDTDDITVIGVGFKTELLVVINKKLVANYIDVDRQLQYLYKKYIPEGKYRDEVTPVFKIVDDELELIKEAMAQLHKWKPDILSIWNMKFDLSMMLNVCKKYNVRPEDIFSDPEVPKEYRYFKFKEGNTTRTTASGVFKPLDVQEIWNVVYATCSFWWIDSMAAYYYVRVGGKKVASGYSLDSILNFEFKKEGGYGKLKFKDEASEHLIGVDWHKYMASKRPLEYIIYNCWDVMSLLALDEKTLDLCISVPLLSGPSGFDIFNSNPKKLVNLLHFFYLERGRVIGTMGLHTEEEVLLGLDSWVKVDRIY